MRRFVGLLVMLTAWNMLAAADDRPSETPSFQEPVILGNDGGDFGARMRPRVRVSRK